MLMFLAVFILAGIGLCIKGHKGWGAFCFVIAFFTLVGMVL
jgi:hypothetical protein